MPKKWTIVAAILAAVLLPLAVMTVYTILTARDSMQREILRTAATDSQGVAIAVARDFEFKFSILKLVALRPLLQEAMRRRDRAAVTRHLLDLSAAVPDFERAFVTAPAGVLWADHPSIDPAVIGRSFAHRDWYRGVTASGRPYLSEAFERAARPVRRVYNFAAPVHDGRDKLVGYLVVQDTGEHLKKEIEKLSLPIASNIVVLDRNGRPAFELGDSVMPRLESIRDQHRCVDGALQGGEGTEFARHNGRDFVVVCTPVSGAGWAVVTHLSMDQVLAPLRSMAWQMGAAGMFLLLLTAGLATYWANTFADNRRLLTEGRRLNRELDILRNRYWALLDSSGDGLGLASRERIVLHLNRALGRMFDIPDPTALVGHPIGELRKYIFPVLVEPDKFRTEMDRAWADAEAAADFELALTDRRVIHFYSHPVRDERGEMIGRSLVCRDVTRDKEIDRMKSEFVATVSHELRTPLASLLGFSELMLTRKLGEEKQRQFLEVIHKEAARLNALVNDFLDLQRIESGRVSYAFQALEVGGVIREVATLFSSDPRHPLQLELPADLPPVAADRDRIKQVLQNLLSNAIKFSPAGGDVTIAARATANEVEIEVRDRGLGIPADAMPRLFGKFYRVDASDRREIGGTGLGLALCKEIVEAHHGRIWAESADRGSVFRFTLPVRSAAQPAVAASPPLPASAQKPLALIVEDDASFAALVREHLQEERLATHVEPTAEAALETIRTHPPALIILDVHLAGKLDGWDLLIAVKEDPRTASIPVIITTVTERRNRGLALGASDYLVKPFKMERLIEAVRRFFPAPAHTAVLVVDDDDAFRTAVAETLRLELRCDVREAGDGAEALSKIKAQTPELVILDLLMPVMDGFAVLDAIRAHPATANIPVLVVTGKTLAPEEKAHLTQGMARVLTKAEYSHQALAALVRELLGNSPQV